MVANLPPDGTAMWRAGRRTITGKDIPAQAPPDDWWTPERDMFASIVDLLSVQIWQQTTDGRKGWNRPAPIPRPGTTPQLRAIGTVMSLDELQALLRPSNN